jgi:hypothetical protein
MEHEKQDALEMVLRHHEVMTGYLLAATAIGFVGAILMAAVLHRYGVRGRASTARVKAEVELDPTSGYDAPPSS